MSSRPRETVHHSGFDDHHDFMENAMLGTMLEHAGAGGRAVRGISGQLRFPLDHEPLPAA